MSREYKFLLDEAIKAQKSGCFEVAISLYSEIVKNTPSCFDAWNNLGTSWKSLGDFAQAEACIRRALELCPDDFNFLYNLGNTLRAQKKFVEAKQLYEQSLSQNPNFAGGYYNYALTLEDMGDEDGAKAAYRNGIRCDPAHYYCHINLGAKLESEGFLNEAMEHYQLALKISPDIAAAYNNLGQALLNSGKPIEAIKVEQAGFLLETANHRIASNILLAMQYVPNVPDEDLLSSAQSFGRRFPSVNRPRIDVTEPGKLKIGYVSSDLCSHPVGLFVQSAVVHANKLEFEIFCYSNGTREDGITSELAVHTHWRRILNASDEAVAKQIMKDDIDILVDLSGHTSGNRLPLFAMRPAPVQITWLGYFATTGLPAMDFVILDPFHAPAGTEKQFSERIIRLPHNRLCFTPAPFAPEVAPSPFYKNGYVTFGSFNNTAKLNDEVLYTWASVLQAVPNSRLIMKWRTLVDPVYQARLINFFSERGISSDRMDLRTVSVHRVLLEQYADVDIALDPFPFSGGHTSCEALWMGVPVITLPQTSVVSRQTASYLINIGLQELIAKDVRDYVDLAAELAQDPDRLSFLRSTLRERMQTSPLCDAKRFAKDLEEAYRLAWNTVMKEEAELNHQEGIEALKLGQHDLALQKLTTATELNPEVAGYNANLGITLKMLGDPDGMRIAYYKKAVELEPSNVIYLTNLAGALNDLGRSQEAQDVALQATQLEGRYPEAWFNLGSSLLSQSLFDDAAQAFDKATKLRPNWTEAIEAAAKSYQGARKWIDAGKRLEKAFSTLGDKADSKIRFRLWKEMGWCYQNLNKFDDANQCYLAALQMFPEDIEVLTNLGNAYKAQNKLDEALVCYQKVLNVNPESAGGWCNLGTVMQTKGEYDGAIECCQAAITRQPLLYPAWSNLTNCLTYSPNHSPLEVMAAYQEFDRIITAPLRGRDSHHNNRDPYRRLKVGYVSPDFRKHAVAYFALPLIENHSPENVEVYCYYNHLQQDQWTQRFSSRSEHWRSVVGMSDEQLANQIRSDQIDILVDLAGHTEGGRLLAFARKPAPVQVTWMGYVTTTGLSAMDWRVTHIDADPVGFDGYYSEKLYRLPGTMWCYRPLPDMPDVSSPPNIRKGHITFGSFNRYSKNNSLVLEAWAKILNRVANSRLLICIPEGSIRQELAMFMAERGVDPVRIDCFAKVNHQEFWQLHSEVDIALDPFPFGGGTTTCETLWLGVPVVTCTGVKGAKDKADFESRFASRMGYAFLNNLGFSELATETVGDYIEVAMKLAEDPEKLSRLRNDLRPRMATATLTNERQFAQEMEAAYQSMWQAWIEQTNPKEIS